MINNQLDLEHDTKLANKERVMVVEWVSGRVERTPYKANNDGKMPKKTKEMYDKLRLIPTVRRIYVTNKYGNNT